MKKSKNEIIRLIKSKVIKVEKRDLFAKNLRAILAFDEKLKKSIYEVKKPKRNLTQLDKEFRKEIVNTKTTSLSILLWQTTTDKINYSQLSIFEYEFVYKLMPMLQKQIVKMNSASKTWQTSFNKLLLFIAQSLKKMKGKTNCLDLEKIEHFNKKTLLLFKTFVKRRLFQGYGYIYFLLKKLQETNEVNQKNNKKNNQRIMNEVEKQFIKLFSKYKELNKKIYSKRSKTQIDSRILWKHLLKAILRSLSVSKKEAIELVTKNLFLFQRKSGKPRRINLSNLKTIVLLVEKAFNPLIWQNKQLNRKLIIEIIKLLKKNYYLVFSKFDCYESVLLVHYTIIFIIIRSLL